MKEGWKLLTIGDVANIIHGKNQKEVLDSNGPYPIYGSGGSVMGYAKEYLCDEGTTILGRKGSINNPQYINTKFWNVDTAFGISAKQECNKRYLYHFITSINWNDHNSGTTLPSLTQSIVSKIEIPVPPLSEQDRIVKKLDEAFAKIDALKQNAEKGLQAVKDLWQATLKEELMPKEGWIKNILNTIVQVINGRAYSKEELLRKGKYKVLRVGNFFTNDSWYYSDFELEENKYCEKGDLLYAWSASFGPKIWDGDKVIYHYHIWKMIPSYTVDKMFLYYWLQSPVFEHQVMSNLHGATMTHITKGLMESCMLQIPSVNEQKQIVSKIEKVANICLELQNNYEQELSEYESLKQSILRKAFSGEL